MIGDRYNADTCDELLLADGCAYSHTSRTDGSRHYFAPHRVTSQERTGVTVYADGHVAVYSGTYIARLGASGDVWTADPFGLYTALRHGGDFTAAARTLGQAERDQLASDLRSDPSSNTRPPNVDPTTGEIIRPALGDEFWTARPVLEHIRQAAHSRCISAEALLCGVLARVAMLTPPTIGLPPTIVARSPLNLIVAPVGASGAGKSGGNPVAQELLPTRRLDVRDGFLLGSGEGVADAFLGPPEQIDEDGRKRTIRRQLYTAMLAVADEGQLVIELGHRKGSTLLPQLRTAWTGGTLGQENASAERWRRVECGAYSFAAVIALQPKYAVQLLADTAGLAQRLLWSQAHDSTIPDQPPPWPGALDWTPPAGVAFGGDLGVADSIDAEVRTRRLARVRGELVGDELDAHRDLLRLRVAGLLTLLDKRRHIDADDWRLADNIVDASDRNRAGLIADAKLAARDAEDASHARGARREVTIRDTVTDRATTAMAKAIARRVHRVWDAEQRATKRRDAQSACKGSDRREGSFEEGVDLATARGWIVADGDAFRPGESRPT